MIFDAHCDVLYKMWLDESISFQKNKNLHIDATGLIKGKSKVQVFAIFVPHTVPQELKFNVALEMVNIFYEKILFNNPHMKLVKTKTDIANLRDNEIGAMLSLEGCDCIGDDIVKLHTLLRLGVKSVGLTWNFANLVADGALERRNGGLSNFGSEVIHMINDQKIWVDVSHLSEKAFWDVIERATYPIASHSNVRKLCDHPRNLNDDQIKAMMDKNGVIGITFVPQFLVKEKGATLKHVIKHVDYICSLGGAEHVGFGSDFDGITHTVKGLSKFEQYEVLIEMLSKYYKEDVVKGFLFNNFYGRIPL